MSLLFAYAFWPISFALRSRRTRRTSVLGSHTGFDPGTRLVDASSDNRQTSLDSSTHGHPSVTSPTNSLGSGPSRATKVAPPKKRTLSCALALVLLCPVLAPRRTGRRLRVCQFKAQHKHCLRADALTTPVSFADLSVLWHCTGPHSGYPGNCITTTDFYQDIWEALPRYFYHTEPP